MTNASASRRYRKRPVVIEAVPVSSVVQRGTPAWGEMPAWMRDAIDNGTVVYQGDLGVAIRTLEGTMRADQSDWVICGVKGELYPCKPDIFAATYEPVEATP